MRTLLARLHFPPRQVARRSVRTARGTRASRTTRPLPDDTTTVRCAEPQRRSVRALPPGSERAPGAAWAAGAHTSATMRTSSERRIGNPRLPSIGNGRYQLVGCRAMGRGGGATSFADRGIQLLLAGGGLALLAVWWAATSRLSGAGTGEAVTAVGRVTGLLGAYLCLVSLLLMARVPWLERGAGVVRLSTWHRYAGSTALTLILVHVAATAVGYGLVEDTGALHELWHMIGDMSGMVTATIATALLVAVGLTCVQAVRRR